MRKVQMRKRCPEIALRTSLLKRRALLWCASIIAVTALAVSTLAALANNRTVPFLMAWNQTSNEPITNNPDQPIIHDDLIIETSDIEPHAQSGEEIRWFNGRPIRPAKQMTMKVTAYSPDKRSCGRFADGITASGYSVWTNGMKLVAADTRLLPMGSMISIPGYHGGNVVPVLDRGGRIKGHRLDVLYPTHEIAREWGVQDLEVIVWEYADGLPNGFKTRH